MSYEKAARALAEIRSGAKAFADLDTPSKAALQEEIRVIMAALIQPGETMMDAAARFATDHEQWPDEPRRMWQALIDAGAPPRLH